MNSIVAKPVIADRYWILKKDDRKIGQIEADSEGIVVKIQNTVQRYKTLKMAGRAAGIEFAAEESITPLQEQHAYGYDTGGVVHNAMWDVTHRLPLFTRDNKSKSWFAAGWYRVKQHRTWKTVQNPKLITLQRYAYQGPFHTKEQANDKSVS